MIDNDAIVEAIRSYLANNPNDTELFDDIYHNIVNMVAVVRDGKVVVDKPSIRVRARTSYVNSVSEMCSVLVDGLHVDLKIHLKWYEHDYERDKKVYGRALKNGKPISMFLSKSTPLFTKLFQSLNHVEMEYNKSPPVKKLVTDPHICNMQLDGIYPISEWVERYNQIIPENDRIELAQKCRDFQTEFDRLVPIQIDLVRHKRIGNAKTKRSAKRILSLSCLDRISELHALGAQNVYDLITAFIKWERSETRLPHIENSPMEYFGFALTLGAETTKYIFDLYCKHPGALYDLFKWVQDQRGTGELNMSIEDVQEALDLHAVKSVITS